MTNKLTEIESMCRDIVRWLPLLDDAARSISEIAASPLDLAGVHGSGGLSVQEGVWEELERLNQIRVDLGRLVAGWGWRFGRDGCPGAYLLARLSWARANRAPDEYEPVIRDIHRRLARATGHAPYRTGRSCPMCGQELVVRPPSGSESEEAYECGRCGPMTADELAARAKLTLVTHGARMTTADAARLIGVEVLTVLKWVERGRLERGPDGLVSVADVEALARRQ